MEQNNKWAITMNTSFLNAHYMFNTVLNTKFPLREKI